MKIVIAIMFFLIAVTMVLSLAYACWELGRQKGFSDGTRFMKDNYKSLIIYYQSEVEKLLNGKTRDNQHTK